MVTLLIALGAFVVAIVGAAISALTRNGNA